MPSATRPPLRNSCNSWLATQTWLPPQTPAVSTDYVTRKVLPPWKVLYFPNQFCWRRERDSNPRRLLHPNDFQDRRLQPLGHLSKLQGSFFWIEQNKTILYLLYEPLCLFFIKITKNYIFIYFCAIERNRTSTYWGFNPTTLPLSYDDIYHRFGTMVRTCTWNHYNLGSGVHHHFIGVLIKVAI